MVPLCFLVSSAALFYAAPSGVATKLLPPSRIARRPSITMGTVGPGASEQQCTVALVKNIVGTGVLTLPAGIARLSDAGASSYEAFGLATLLILAFGALNAWGFLLIGEACAATQEASYVGAWRKTVGSGSWMPALASLLLCSTAAIACATVIAETGTDLCAAFLGVPYSSISTVAVLAGAAVTILTPLCLLPSLAPLGTASYFGVGGVALTAGAMAWRLLDGSYLPGGSLVDLSPVAPAFTAAAAAASEVATAPALPSFSTGSSAFFICLLSNAYLAHYNAPSVLSALIPLGEEAASAKDAPTATPASQPSASQLSLTVSSSAAQRINAFFVEYIALPSAFTSLLNQQLRLLDLPTPPATPVTITSGRLIDPVGLAPFRRVVVTSFVTSALFFLVIAGTGFATFGDSSNALILNSYASDDSLATLARVGVLACVLVEFPLLERPFRLTAVELLGEPDFGAAPWCAVLSVATLTAIAGLGVELDIISALGGSTGGALLICTRSPPLDGPPS